MLPLKMCNAGYVRSVRCTSAPSTASLRLKQTSSRKLRSTAEDSSGEEQKPDIDALAAFLSKRAVEMRASMDEWDVMMSQEDSYAADEALDTLDGQTDAAASASAEAAAPKGAADLGQPSMMTTMDMVDALDEKKVGEFLPQDFQIVKLLGRVGMQDAAASMPSSGSTSPGGILPSLKQPNIIVYAARYNSGLPYEGPVTVQLREYLKHSRRMAVNELRVQQRLCGDLPQDKWQAAVANRVKGHPIVPILGYLEAPPSDEALAIKDDPSDTLWLVYKFEGMRPMSLMLQSMDLPEEPTGFGAMFMKKEDAVSAALQARHNLLTAIARGLLQALSFCHQRGVAHCGLGCGSVVLNTWRDKEVGQLRVKLDNFGLARVYEHPLEPPEGDSSSSAAVLSSDDTDAAMQRQQDLQAAALLLAEVFMVGSGASGAEVMDLAALQRLLFDVFHEDIALFKEYCLQDEDNYNGFVEFMDMHRGAGWELLDRLLRGETAAGELLRTSRFFNRISSDVAVE